MYTDEQKKRASVWFSSLQDTLIQLLESFEESALFARKTWTREGGGGGTMALLKGDVFEKAGVNVSTVFGEFSKEFQCSIPGAQENPTFWASGISVVVHPRSPHIPIIHMNTRMIVTQKGWFGGGIDLTPCLPNKVDTKEFHQALKTTCDEFNTTYYPTFKAEADTYFYLPHRNEPRGVGGIFYDNVNSEDWETDFAFTQAVGTTFGKIYAELVKRHLHTPWGDAEREIQLRKRGRYVEFNLIYDRGTHFGLKTNGNIEAIFMSLPPLVAWE
jgi:coproporphyrinogen III oxidase